MKNKASWYWFSFSLKGDNQGCCNVEAESKGEAEEKVAKLGILPNYDSRLICQMEKPELQPNKLIAREKLIELKYEPRYDL